MLLALNFLAYDPPLVTIAVISAYVIVISGSVIVVKDFSKNFFKKMRVYIQICIYMKCSKFCIRMIQESVLFEAHVCHLKEEAL